MAKEHLSSLMPVLQCSVENTEIIRQVKALVMPLEAELRISEFLPPDRRADAPAAGPGQALRAPGRGASHARPGVGIAPAPEQAARPHAAVHGELDPEFARSRGSAGPSQRCGLRLAWGLSRRGQPPIDAAAAQPEPGQRAALGLGAEQGLRLGARIRRQARADLPDDQASRLGVLQAIDWQGPRGVSA